MKKDNKGIDPRIFDDGKNSSRSIGFGMLVVFWVGVLLVAAYFAGNWLDKGVNPNSKLSTLDTVNYKEVILKRNIQGHYVAAGAINGHAVSFLLDTGATFVSLPAATADKIGLKRMYRAKSTTANGVIDVFGTRLNKVSLGTIELDNVAGSINPQMGKGDKILLGMSFLKHLEIVQHRDSLVLRQYKNSH